MEMEVELEGEDGSKFALGTADKAFFGRGSGFNTNDRTVSRRHVSFQLIKSESDSEPPRVSFQVIGRNPVWVCTHKDGRTLRLFRKFDKGHLEFGDRFCLSGKAPLWFDLKKNSSSRSELNFDEVDVSAIDPVKEFGFLVMGHEFDQYPKGMIRNVKNWEWFLEEPRKDSDDDEDSEKERRKMRRKRKTFKDNDDDEWTGDSEDDKDLVAKMGKGKKPGYSTRSKDSKGPNRDAKAGRNSKTKKATGVNETVKEDDEEEEEETLGGFIVADEEDDQEEESDDDEEEEFEDDDDDEMED
ncbi:SMAD/FHA domain superfamily [Sesbania bispinosa]|nr:SMAD/FHA domain superfamily [Sesbania bispinosa]